MASSSNPSLRNRMHLRPRLCAALVALLFLAEGLLVTPSPEDQPEVEEKPEVDAKWTALLSQASKLHGKVTKRGVTPRALWQSGLFNSTAFQARSLAVGRAQLSSQPHRS